MPLVRQIFKFQFIALFKTFPLGGRCPRKGADEGNILPLISQKSKIFASFSPGRSFCAFGAKEYDKSQFCTLHSAFCISCVSTITPNLYHKNRAR